MEEEYLFIPSRNFQKLISLLVILPSILSFMGSSLIIYFVRCDSKKSPYRRILFAMSVCDIIASIGWVTQPYLMTSDAVNSYVWSFGNNATCALQGGMTQFGISTHLYAACLSLHFLLTIRYGVSESRLHKLERWTHTTIILFATGTSIYGVASGRMSPLHVGPGCWVSHPPEGNYCENDSCGAAKIAWIFAGFPTLMVLTTIAVSNVLLFCHVRSKVVQGSQQGSHRTNQRNDDGQNFPSDGSTHSILILKRKKVKDVSKQCFLYVLAYLLTFIWAFVKQAFDGQGFDKVPGSGAYFLPLTILQSVFAPSQGFWNALIFFRPKYFQSRMSYPSESRLWSMKRAILGNRITPTAISPAPQVWKHKNVQKTAMREIDFTGEVKATTPGSPHIDVSEPNVAKPEMHKLAPLTRSNMSTLTCSRGDFDHVPDESALDSRWEAMKMDQIDDTGPNTAFRRISLKASLHDKNKESLHAISGMSRSTSDSISIAMGSEFEDGNIDRDGILSHRWDSFGDSNHADFRATPTLTKPERRESNIDCIVGSESFDEVPLSSQKDPTSRTHPVDTPLRIPQRPSSVGRENSEHS